MGLGFEIIASSITTFVCAFLAIKVFNPLALEYGLVDTPSARKRHQGDIPLIGGIAIFAAVLAATLIWMPNTQELRIYLIASSMMVFVGAIDDRYDLSVSVRIVGQIIIASLMIYGVGTYISNLGDLFSLGDIDLGWIGIPFTYFAILVAINAFNMIDGIDGLLGSLSINTFASVSILYLLQGDSQEVVYPLMLAAAICPYLLFNLGYIKGPTKKIFMGDAGSMFIGLTIVWLLSRGSQGESASFNPVTALWITAIPLMDMLAIILRRYKKGLSPFKPDREHLHHIFMRAGFSERRALFTITCCAGLLSAIGIIGDVMGVPQSIMFGLFLALFAGYSWCIQHVWLVIKFFKVTPEQEKQ